MKTSFKKQSKYAFFMIVFVTLFFNGHLYAGENVGSIGVIDPESAGDEATIARVKAKILTVEADSDGNKTIDEDGEKVTYIDEDGAISMGSCGDINIGNVKTEVGASAPSTNIVIIEGPVVQQNECN